MKMVLVLGGLGFVMVSAITLLVVRAVRRSRLAEEQAKAATDDEARRKAEEEARQRVEEQAKAAAEAEARLRAEEEARIAAEEARRRTEDEARREAEKARIAAETDARRRAEAEARRKAEEGARQRAEEQAKAAAEAEARRRAEEEVRAAAEEARRGAEQEARREAERARIAAEPEAPRAAEDESRSDAEEESRINAEADARRQAEEETRQAEDEPSLAASPGTPIRAPRQYRPVARVPAVPAAPRPPVAASVERETRDRALPIDVRLVFEKAGFCRVSLLPRRAPGMPVEVAVLGSDDPPEFLALQEEWYQDVVLPNAGHLLREGVEWAGALPAGQQARWSLSGREIYVLARHDELNGFVNAPRLILGEEQVVLCAAERLPEVHSAIALTGSPEPALLGSESGVPEGWIGLRGVVPQTPMAPSPDSDIFDALRPLAEVQIAFDGGIKIERQAWLSGFPPRVRLRGDTGAISSVVIDGCEAMLSHEGGYVVPGWDSLGDHTVWCASGSRTYAIREGAEEWEPWDAYTWSLGETTANGAHRRPAICGVLARPPRIARAGGHAVLVAASNPVLIGAAPGEIEFCAPRGDVRAKLCLGFPWFEPVWAIPAHALHCDKRFARVLLIGNPRPVAAGKREASVRAAERRRRAHGPGVYAWCVAIRAAGRKGLQTEPQQADLADLWKEYKQRAKALWRSMR